MTSGSLIERETKRRIDAAVAAYAYEFEDRSIMLDHDFDRLCLQIDPSVETGRPDLDHFFKTQFDPYTGS